MLIATTRRRTVAAGGGLPLDAYTTNLAGAYSFGRRLLTGHTGNIMQIRRESDNATANVGYDGSNNTNQSAITTHAPGLDDAFVSILYDQSGNTRNLAQATSANQLRVKHDAALDTQNSQVCSFAEDGNSYLLTSALTAYTGTTLSGYIVAWIATGGVAYSRLLGFCNESSADWNSSATIAAIMRSAGSTNLMAQRNSADLSAGVSFTSEGIAFAAGFRLDGTNYNLRVGSNTASAASSSSLSITRFLLQAYTPTNPFGSGPGAKFHEVACWFGDIGDTAMQAILGNARTYWSAV